MLKITTNSSKPSKSVAKPGSNYFWKEADKARAVAAYSVTGSFSKAATIVGIPEITIRSWSKQEWFSEELLRAKQADTDELGSTFTRLAKLALVQLEDRLENGDEVVTKEGKVIQKRISAKEAAIVAGVAVDKRKILFEQPITVASQSSAEKLLTLMEQFIKFNKAKEIKGEVLAEDSGETGITIESEGVLEVEQLRHRDQSVTEVGESEEGLDGAHVQGSEAGQHDPSGASQGPSS